MMPEEKKWSIFNKFFWGTKEDTDNISWGIDNSVDDFDTWISLIDSFIKQKDWKKATKAIDQLRKNEKKNTNTLLKNSSEDKKDSIKKLHLNKLEWLLDYEKNIENLIKKEKEDKKSKILDDKIIYVKNRFDYYIKSGNYKKARDVLDSFYQKNRDENIVSEFYNNEIVIFDDLKTEKKWFFSFLSNKSENKNDKDENKSIEKEIIEEKIEEMKEEKIEIKEKKVWFFWKMFSKSKEKPKVNNFDSAIKLIESLIISKDLDKARSWLNQIRKKEEWAYSILSDEIKKKQEWIYNSRLKTIDSLLNKITEEEKFLDTSAPKEEISNIKEEVIEEIKEEKPLEKVQDPIESQEAKVDKEVLTQEVIEETKAVALDGNNEISKENIENSVVDTTVEKNEEVKKLWISELNNKSLDEDIKKPETGEIVENKNFQENQVVNSDDKSNVINNDLSEPNQPKWDGQKVMLKDDEIVIQTDNKEEVKTFFSKFFNKDAKNLDKVASLMESLMNIKDIDKAISTVEAVKNIDWKNVVISENNWVSQINSNQIITDKVDANTQNVISDNTNPIIEEPKKWELKVENKELILKQEEEKRKEEEKKINVLEIKDYDWAIKWIKYFISIKDFKKAKLWVDEIKIKEEKAFNELYDKIDVEKVKKKQKDIYHKKLIEIEKILDYLEDEEIKYNEKKEIEKFKLKFEQIKTKLDELMWMKKYYESLDLISNFFEENKNSIVVINFYNKWKNEIQKKIKKQELDKEKQVAKNARKEAEILIWENLNLSTEQIPAKIIDWKKVDSWFFKKISERLNFYKKVKQKLREKRLLDEVTMLIESQNEVDEMAKKIRLENMHMWLIKELDNDKLLWYELYAKILWKEKISWDTFWFVEDTWTYKFFLWDATWHWVQAWLIVTLLTRLFYNFSKENFLEKLVYEVNNWLKQDLKSWNFITWIFFEVDKNNLDSIKYVWMWHEPMLIYRKNTMEVEKYIAWWLAAWIRIISDINNIKTSNIKVNDWDVVFIYSDWVVESRNKSNELLWIEWFSNIIKKVCMNQTEWKITNIYSSLIEEIKDYRWWSVNFFDDATIFILKRNSQKDVIDKKSMYLKDLSMREWLSKKNVRELEWKTKEEIEKELEKIRKQKQLNLIISNLEKLYITWEVLKLKQEAIRYIKEWFIHKKINRYLKKAITNERQYKIDLKDQKMKSRYIVLKELLKKWDYYTVIKETQEIIASDGNITI